MCAFLSGTHIAKRAEANLPRKEVSTQFPLILLLHLNEVS